MSNLLILRFDGSPIDFAYFNKGEIDLYGGRLSIRDKSSNLNSKNPMKRLGSKMQLVYIVSEHPQTLENCSGVSRWLVSEDGEVVRLKYFCSILQGQKDKSRMEKKWYLIFRTNDPKVRPSRPLREWFKERYVELFNKGLELKKISSETFFYHNF